MRILAIVAHPADAFDMIGGTLASHAEAGDQVVLVVLQQNDTANVFALADELREHEVSEEAMQKAVDEHIDSVKTACSILGLDDVRFLEYGGEWILHSEKLVSDTATLIQDVKPHLVLTHHPMEDGGAFDHATVGKVVVEAAYLSEGARRNRRLPHHVGQIYFFCPPGMTTWLDATTAVRYPSIMIDVTDHMEKKVKAYAQLSKQYIDMATSAKIMEAVCGAPGIHARAPYVETFQPYRPEVYKRLPVSDHNVWLSDASWKEGMERLRLLAPYFPGVRG